MTKEELADYYRRHKSKAQKVDVMIARLVILFFVLTIGLEWAL